MATLLRQLKICNLCVDDFYTLLLKLPITCTFKCTLMLSTVVALQPPPLPVSPPPPDVTDERHDDSLDRSAASPDDLEHQATRADEEIAFQNDVILQSADGASPRSPHFDLDRFDFAGQPRAADNELASPELDPQELFMRLKEVSFPPKVSTCRSLCSTCMYADRHLFDHTLSVRLMICIIMESL